MYISCARPGKRAGAFCLRSLEAPKTGGSVTLLYRIRLSYDAAGDIVSSDA